MSDERLTPEREALTIEQRVYEYIVTVPRVFGSSDIGYHLWFCHAQLLSHQQIEAAVWRISKKLKGLRHCNHSVWVWDYPRSWRAVSLTDNLLDYQKR